MVAEQQDRRIFCQGMVHEFPIHDMMLHDHIAAHRSDEEVVNVERFHDGDRLAMVHVAYMHMNQIIHRHPLLQKKIISLNMFILLIDAKKNSTTFPLVLMK